MCCQTPSSPEPAAWRRWPGARPGCQPAPGRLAGSWQRAKRATRWGARGMGRWTSDLRSSGSGGWREERTRDTKGQKVENLCTKRKRKLKLRSSVAHKRAGQPAGSLLGETGGSNWSWEGPEAETLLAKFYRPLNQHPSSQSGETELGTSIESRLQGRGLRAAQPGARPPGSLLYWATTGSEAPGIPQSALSPGSPNPPAKRKVQETA